ncbi:YdcF family protein [Terrabacter sp. 2RAF25]|uniref:YdcF family protein n=1 Tax=Terrabacter sp. 2RAF25 TaxID=3232998 RepID=UPI003F951E5E
MPAPVDLLLAAAGAALLLLALSSSRAEPRRWRSGVFLTGSLWAVSVLAVNLLSPTTPLVAVLTLPWLAAAVLGLLFAGSALSASVRDGRSLAGLLALVLGAAMVAATVLATAAVVTDHSVPVVGAVVLLLPGCPGLAFVSYLLYCLLQGRAEPRPGPVAVVVLGSGLVDGTVPTLLANRLTAAIDAWHAEREAGREPLVLPSGGQGDDEPMPEGVAMAAYLVAHGVPTSAVATEDRATTTEENLLLSREILRSRGLDADGHLRVVTSGYHVGRAALITRSLGIDADVTGAPAAWHFVPSAFLREFLAAVTYRPRTNVAGLLLWAGLTALLAYAAWPR